MFTARLVYENSHLSHSLSLDLLTCYIRRTKMPYGEPHVARN